MADKTLAELQQECYEIARSKGWWPAGREKLVPELLMLMVTELAEAMEEWRNGHGPTETYFRENGKPEGFPMELADLMIRVLDCAGGLGINLQEAIETKMAYNRTRAHRHGGKLA